MPQASAGQDRRSAARSTSAQRGAAKGTAKKTSAKQSSARKTSVKQSSAKQSSAKKTSAEKSPVQKPDAKKATPTKTAPQKTAPNKTAKKPAARSGGARKPAAVRLPVLPGEDPWTVAELAEVRGELETDRERLLGEVSAAEREIKVLLRDGGDGAGSDQADVGSNALERDAEMSLANNSRELLFQVERALTRLDDGSYGVCESCGAPIGKLRVMAFPRATLCMSCKQRQERR